MSSKNRNYTIKKTGDSYDLEQAIVSAIRNNAKDYLSPPIKNIGYKGILKTSTEIKKWFKNSNNISRDFKTTAMLMEKAGTGGALFRNLYRDFLKESASLLKSDLLQEAHAEFTVISGLWSEVSLLLDKASETKNEAYINQASDILVLLSQKERRAMELLIKIQ